MFRPRSAAAKGKAALLCHNLCHKMCHKAVRRVVLALLPGCLFRLLAPQVNLVQVRAGRRLPHSQVARLSLLSIPK